MKIRACVRMALVAVAPFMAVMPIAEASVSVVKIYDGDTITLASGEKVRLIQIDTPELSPAECFGQEAKAALVSLLSSGGQITLKSDPKLDKVDRYGRLLRYVFAGSTNLNLKLIEIGAAAPYFYRGEKGQYSAQMLKAAQSAKAKSLGLWKKCPGTTLTPKSAISTVSDTDNQMTTVSTSNGKCDPNYAGCIPIFPSDVDCSDIKRLGLAPVRVIGTDIHKLDRDGDGIGCDK